MLDRSIVDTGDATVTDGAVDTDGEALWSAGTNVCIEISLSHIMIMNSYKPFTNDTDCLRTVSKSSLATSYKHETCNYQSYHYECNLPEDFCQQIS